MTNPIAKALWVRKKGNLIKLQLPIGSKKCPVLSKKREIIMAVKFKDIFCCADPLVEWAAQRWDTSGKLQEIGPLQIEVKRLAKAVSTWKHSKSLLAYVQSLALIVIIGSNCIKEKSLKPLLSKNKISVSSIVTCFSIFEIVKFIISRIVLYYKTQKSLANDRLQDLMVKEELKRQS